MELKIALYQADQILSEERLRPTLAYIDRGVNWTTELKRLTEQLKAGEILKPEALAVAADGSRRLNISGMRAQNPRTVSETPEQYELVGANYGYLLKVTNQLASNDQDAFATAIMDRIVTHGDYVYTVKDYHYPQLDHRVSELPLVAEFAVRTGRIRQLFQVLASASAPTPGIALVMMQLADTLSFNFTAFPKADLEVMGPWLKTLHDMADLQTHSARGPRGGAMVPNAHYKAGREKEAREIVTQVHNLLTEINQALYFYLKGALDQSPNLEVDNDRQKVLGFIESLGFNPLLTQSLNEAEKHYRADATGFELKNCMHHLRSFLEELHMEASEAVSLSAGEQAPQKKWGKAIHYLRTHSVLSAQEEAFVTSLYTLISDEGVHPLIAEREYVRIRRNMVTEYGLLFLTVLERKGLRGRAVTP